MNVTITMNKIIEIDGCVISDGSIKFEDGTMIEGVVQSSHCNSPVIDINTNTTKYNDDDAEVMLGWSQIVIGLDEGESRTLDFVELIKESGEWFGL